MILISFHDEATANWQPRHQKRQKQSQTEPKDLSDTPAGSWEDGSGAHLKRLGCNTCRSCAYVWARRRVCGSGSVCAGLRSWWPRVPGAAGWWGWRPRWVDEGDPPGTPRCPSLTKSRWKPGSTEERDAHSHHNLINWARLGCLMLTPPWWPVLTCDMRWTQSAEVYLCAET